MIALTITALTLAVAMAIFGVTIVVVRERDF